MAEYKTPGVYTEEIPHFPPPVVSVETAMPVFIGYTEKAMLNEANDLTGKPRRIRSLPEYEQLFGMAFPETAIEVTFDVSNPVAIMAAGKINPATASKFLLYYSMQLFFANGGGDCYIISVGNYGAAIISDTDLRKGLDAAGKEKGITLLVFPDAVNLPAAVNCYGLYRNALDQCAQLRDRFTVMDVWTAGNPAIDDIQLLRNYDFGDNDSLKYGAVYYPRLYSTVNVYYADERTVKINGVAGAATLSALKTANKVFYALAKSAINDIELLLPACGAVVGVYASVDRSSGVWKAPANVSITMATRPEILINNQQQDILNIDAAGGKSINAIRSFTGKSPAMIWGTRTLAGNDNEWRYVPVRRFFIMVEESVRLATDAFVFEPNNLATWTRIKSMVSNYLLSLWQAGALQGAKPEAAYFINIGLGETMTELDIQEGRMITEIGMAATRPAEFIILRICQIMNAT